MTIDERSGWATGRSLTNRDGGSRGVAIFGQSVAFNVILEELEMPSKKSEHVSQPVCIMDDISGQSRWEPHPRRRTKDAEIRGIDAGRLTSPRSWPGLSPSVPTPRENPNSFAAPPFLPPSHPNPKLPLGRSSGSQKGRTPDRTRRTSDGSGSHHPPNGDTGQ